ncbi:5654_t:CDS:2, partial [Acaulospora colombiana]
RNIGTLATANQINMNLMDISFDTYNPDAVLESDSTDGVSAEPIDGSLREKKSSCDGGDALDDVESDLSLLLL